MIIMNTKLALLVVAMALAAGLTNNAFAHKSQVVGDYLIEVGWKEEPVIAGLDNAITVAITPATADDKANAGTMNDAMSADGMTHETSPNEMASNDTASTVEEHHDEEEEGPLENGISGLESTLEVTVTLNGEKTTLSMTEDSDNPGMYIGEFTPSVTGYPMVSIFTTIDDIPVEATFHPEEIEDGAVFDEISSDGSVNVHVVTTAPTQDSVMTVKLAFTDEAGNLIEHVNYDISATQNDESVLSETEVHTDMGEDQHLTSSLTSDAPVDVQVKILGIGEGDKANWSGPQEELSSIHVTPEFGPMVLAMFGVAIVATIGLRSKIPKF
jgi:hypothetical protein